MNITHHFTGAKVTGLTVAVRMALVLGGCQSKSLKQENALLRQENQELRNQLSQRGEAATPADALASPARHATRAGHPAAAVTRTYEVKRGDTLSHISLAMYGSATKWMPIYEANRDVIGENHDRLKVGMKLTIPPVTTQATPAPRTAAVVQK